MKGSATVTPSIVLDANKVGKNDVFLPVNAKIIIEGNLTPVGGTLNMTNCTVTGNTATAVWRSSKGWGNFMRAANPVKRRRRRETHKVSGEATVGIKAGGAMRRV